MLAQTEDIIPVIAPIIWPIFGSMMALRYPTQPLRVAVSTPTLSILLFVVPEDDVRPPDFQILVRNFANFWLPMAHTIMEDKKQIEYNFVTLMRARARCALPISLEFHPVEWLHVVIDPSTGVEQDFSRWDEEAILRTLTNATQRLGGRRKGSMLEKLLYRIFTDTSRMYNPRTEPRANAAMILTNITFWTDPPMVTGNLPTIPDVESRCTEDCQRTKPKDTAQQRRNAE